MTGGDRVLVTGGLGFQGLYLARRLAAEGRRVTVLNTPSVRAMRAARTIFETWAGVPGKIRLVYGSSADPELLEKVLPEQDAVVHMAAWASVDVSLDRPWPPHEINATGTVALLDGLRRFGKPGARVLVASSCEVYGPAVRVPNTREARVEAGLLGLEGGSYLPQRETDEHRPRSPYAASKSAADRYAYAYAVAYDMDLTILRPCNVYGPFQRAGAAGAVIPTMTKAALTGADVVVTGGGRQSREFAHVDDVVGVYAYLLGVPAREPGEAFNVASGESRTMLEIAEAVCVRFFAGVDRVEVRGGRVADVSAFRLDGSKLASAHPVTAYRRVTKFDDGLAAYFDWAESPAGRAWLLEPEP